MALSKDRKTEQISELEKLFGDSKMTVVAQYRGLTVKSIQALRSEAKGNGTKIKVVKNRLVKQAMKSNDNFKDTDTSELKDQLLYVFNAEDEVAPAQVIHAFSKKDDSLQFVGAISADGRFLSKDEVKALAVLPSKQDLIAQVVATLASPAGDVIGALSGGLPSILGALEGKE